MIGLSVLSEQDGWLKRSLPSAELQAFCETHRIALDAFDYDQHTFRDLLDYMDFQEYEHYLFVLQGDGERTLRLVAYLQHQMLHVQFHLIRQNGEVLFGQPDFLNGLFLPQEALTVPASFPDVEHAILSLMTGVYPGVPPHHPQPLRHVYLEDSSLLDRIPATHFNTMTINSVLYFDHPMRHDLPIIELMSRTPMLLAFSDSLSPLDTYLAVLSRDELTDRLYDWHQTGRIRNEQKSGVLDYATLSGLEVSHRLFFFEDGIYADRQKTVQLSKDLSQDIEMLREHPPQPEALASQAELALFPLLYQLAGSFEGDSHFITPYSDLELPRTSGRIGPLTSIGIRNAEGCFVFDRTNMRLFETNEAFLWILEADQKEQFDVLPERLGAEYETAIQHYKELMYHG
ncbi:hypothetical protein ACRPK8_02805 [Exiguobacterium sp. TDN 0502]|uniref:hypothetical protein n=1 Tax=Exiguobacterium sp. TDN 0502 TaxID=3420731 RepID=UPI003D77C1A6